MTAKDLVQYFSNPDLLAALPLEELLAQTQQYPYQANLQLLLTLKAKRERHPDYEYFLQRLAALTFDRPHLYHLLHSQAVPTEETGETLELRALEELELAPLAVPFEELPSRLNEAPLPAAPPPTPPSTPAPATNPPVAAVPPPVASAPTPVGAVSEGWVATADAYLSATVLRSPSPSVPGATGSGPQPVTAFTEVLQRYQRDGSLRERLERVRRQRQMPSSTGTGVGGAAGEEVAVSETLARLLATQGQYHRAIRMYHRLALLYPEKKPIFAALVQQLKEKL